MKYGAEGYGVYFMLLERLRDEKGYMSIKDYNMLAFDLRVDASILKSVIEDFGLFAFTEDGKCFYSEGFNTRMEIKDEKSKKLSEAGKKGAAKRWNKEKDSHPIATPSKSDGNKSKVNESKVNKTKEKEYSSSAPDGILKSFQSFQKLWYFPNDFQKQDLMDFIETYSDDLVDAAIKVAGTKDVKKSNAINFIESCLQEWADANVTNLEQAREYQRQRGKKNQHSKQPYHQSPQKVEEMPDWSARKESKLTPEQQAEMAELEKMFND